MHRGKRGEKYNNGRIKLTAKSLPKAHPTVQPGAPLAAQALRAAQGFGDAMGTFGLWVGFWIKWWGARGREEEEKRL